MVNKSRATRRNVTSISVDTDYKPFRAKIIKNSAIISTNMGLMPGKKLIPDYDETLIIRHFQELMNTDDVLCLSRYRSDV